MIFRGKQQFYAVKCMSHLQPRKTKGGSSCEEAVTDGIVEQGAGSALEQTKWLQHRGKLHLAAEYGQGNATKNEYS